MCSSVCGVVKCVQGGQGVLCRQAQSCTGLELPTSDKGGGRASKKLLTV